MQHPICCWATNYSGYEKPGFQFVECLKQEVLQVMQKGAALPSGHPHTFFYYYYYFNLAVGHNFFLETDHHKSYYNPRIQFTGINVINK